MWSTASSEKSVAALISQFSTRLNELQHLQPSPTVNNFHPLNFQIHSAGFLRSGWLQPRNCLSSPFEERFDSGWSSLQPIRALQLISYFYSFPFRVHWRFLWFRSHLKSHYYLSWTQHCYDILTGVKIASQCAFAGRWRSQNSSLKAIPSFFWFLPGIFSGVRSHLHIRSLLA